MAQVTPTIVVDPNVLSREGLEHILIGSAFRVVAAVPDLSETITQSLGKASPGLLIMCMADDTETAAQALSQFRQEHPSAHIAVLADDYDHQRLLTALRLGVSAYLTRTITSDLLLKSLDLVMFGETVFPSAILSLVGCDMPRPADIPERDNVEEPLPLSSEGDRVRNELSTREHDILQCLIQGESNKVIARKLDIAEATVKVHIKGLLRKIRVRNRTQAAIWAMKNGFVRKIDAQPHDMNRTAITH